MELLASRFDVSGVDIDADMVRQANSRGSVVAQADAYDLPYEDESIDMVYCSFLMLWLDDPARAIGEMKRVAKDWVVCLAEPDYGGRVDHPAELTEVTRYLAVEIEELGGDPYVGRKLRSYFAENGMEGEIGVHQGVWDMGTLRRESKEEWANIARAAEPRADIATIRKSEAVWESALEAGDLFQFNPIFYALGKKQP